jgi:hypothetical protein
MKKIEPARGASPARRPAAWVAVFLLAAGAASAQVYPGGNYPGGNYPGGNYPGGGYPGGNYPGSGSGTGIPIPRGKSNPKTSTKGEPMPSFRGKLQSMDSKTIVIALDDDRKMEFTRNDKTKFFKNGEQVKTPQFSPGDQLSVEGPEDEKGYMIAVNVYWELAAGANTAAAKDDKSGTVDTWKDKPNEAPAGAPVAHVEPPSKPDAEDPGPPKLRRGAPADAAREHAAEPPADAAAPAPQGAPTAAAATPPPVYWDADDAPVPEARPQPGDDLIRRAAGAAFDFTEGLPNYVCQEQIARFSSQMRPADWRSIDLMSAAVVYENGKEDYRNIQVNGKPRQSFKDSGGAWSTGEFGTVLIELFEPGTGARFHYRRGERIAGVNARVYDYDVEHARSRWNVMMASQSYTPAYKGSVWIDPETARVLRVEMKAYGLPETFPADTVESATDYQYVQLGDARRYLLPVHSENLTCQRGTDLCSRNTIDFRNYHKYTGESSVTFDAQKK